MAERSFVDSLIQTISRRWPGSAVQRSSDRYTLGVPDLLVWAIDPAFQTPICIAIEAKQLSPLMPDWTHKGRRTGAMLEHGFMGPQISMLRKLKKNGVDAFGLVRVGADTAIRIDPDALPSKTGNFTYEEMVESGWPIHRKEGLWVFWEKNHAQVPGSRHRDDSRERAR